MRRWRLDTRILIGPLSIDLLHNFRVGGIVGLVVSTGVHEGGLLECGWRQIAQSVFDQVTLRVSSLGLIGCVLVGFQQVKNVVVAIEKVDRAGGVVNPQKVHEKSDHHVLLGFTSDFILPRFTNGFKFYNLKLLRFVQILKALAIGFN